MAVVRCREWADEGGADWGPDTQTLTRSYDVFTDDPTDGAMAVLSADLGPDDRIPQLGEAYFAENEDSSALKVVRVSPKRDAENPCKWRVTVEYSTEANSSPLDLPAEVQWSAVEYQVGVDKDVATGRAIVNSAGEPFDPAPEKSEHFISMRVTRNEAATGGSAFVPATVISTYLDKVNSGTFAGFAGGIVKCVDISASSGVENDVPFWRVTYVFHAKSGGWMLRLVDNGMRRLVGGVPVPIQDNSGQPISRPVLLDGSGQQLANPTTATAVERSFTIYGTIDFSPLGLG